MEAKEGHQEQGSCGATGRSGIIRAVITSAAFAVGVGVVFIARRTFSAAFPSRKPGASAGASESGVPLQQITRWRAADGTHTIQATLQAEFEPGNRSATLHVAFCPPFERLPSAEVAAIDESDAAIGVTQLLHNGVQIEVRLPQPAGKNQTVSIELVATDAPL